jgi:isoquinoline 1-oxidoreductase beta subunit
MVYASIERCPVLGGKIVSYDDVKALKNYGVLTTVKMPEMEYPVHFKPWGGIAVVATNTWAAIRARTALEIRWNKGKNEETDTTQARQAMMESVTNPATVVKKQGNVTEAFSSAKTTLDAVYHTPMMAHAPMEPMCCVASFTDDGRCEIWAPTQTPQSAQKHVAEFLGMNPEDVTVHVTLLGGAFGRKAKPDFIIEAAFISKSIGKPVKLQWTREDDIHFGYYHAPSVQYLKAGLDNSGKLTGWLHRTAFPTIRSTFTEGADYPATWEHNGGFSSERYDIPNLLLEGGKADTHVRIGWFRSVASNHHSFVVNAFTGECAHAAKQDQLAFYLALLGGDNASDELAEDELDTLEYNPKRMRKVLKTVAKAADWGKTLPDNEAIGLAVNWSFDSYTAHAVHVALINGKINVKTVETAIDCGTYINRDRVSSQMEGATLMGLCWAQYHEITTDKGAVQQSNFHDYPMLRINEAPDIRVHIIDNLAKPGGAGEPGITTVVPALTNALLQITGEPIRQLPIKLS